VKPRVGGALKQSTSEIRCATTRLTRCDVRAGAGVSESVTFNVYNAFLVTYTVEVLKLPRGIVLNSLGVGGVGESVEVAQSFLELPAAVEHRAAAA